MWAIFINLSESLSAFYCIYLSWEHESLIIRRGNKERNERIRPLFSWLIAFCCGLLCVIILSSVWIHVNFPGDYLAFFFFFFMFCHSISSTFSLFYFHFKGLGGTDVVSNACLLPHCLKVRDDYFLMKLHTLARGGKKRILPVSCEIDKQYFHIILNGEHSFISHHKGHFEVFLSCQMCFWTLNFD